KNFCDKFLPSLSGDLVFMATYNEFTAKIPLIEAAMIAQKPDFVGAVKGKNKYRGELLEQLVFLSQQLMAYARTNNLPDLAAGVNYSRRKLVRMNDPG